MKFYANIQANRIDQILDTTAIAPPLSGSLLFDTAAGAQAALTAAAPTQTVPVSATTAIETVEDFPAFTGASVQLSQVPAGVIWVFEGGIRLAPGKDYTVAGRVITFTDAIVVPVNIAVGYKYQA